MNTPEGTLNYTYDLAGNVASIYSSSLHGAPQAGTPKKGYRMDQGHPTHEPGEPGSGPHFNWWDYTGGKRGRGGRSGTVPIG